MSLERMLRPSTYSFSIGRAVERTCDVFIGASIAIANHVNARTVAGVTIGLGNAVRSATGVLFQYGILANDKIGKNELESLVIQSSLGASRIKDDNGIQCSAVSIADGTFNGVQVGLFNYAENGSYHQVGPFNVRYRDDQFTWSLLYGH
jgi:hypothetical protein